MPKGRFPFRRTLEFLSAGRVILKKDVRSVMLSYTHKEESKGLRNFIFKDLPQIQFKNNGVQFIASRNTSEIPKVDVFFGDGRKVLIDVEDKKAPEILDIFEKVAGATESYTNIIILSLTVNYRYDNSPSIPGDSILQTLENMATVTVFVKSQGKYHARPGFQDQEHENLNHGKRRKAEIKITP
ncbi:hypothetical protein QZH41_019420, partial [Actinostola sp. cb2023]